MEVLVTVTNSKASVKPKIKNDLNSLKERLRKLKGDLGDNEPLTAQEQERATPCEAHSEFCESQEATEVDEKPEIRSDLKEQSTIKSEPRTAKEWEKEILFLMHASESKKTTKVKQTELITDARELFGSDMKKKVSLRTAEDHRMGRPIVLKQFDPNLKTRKVVCRYPKCKTQKPKSDIEEGKRDLYLCLDHRKKLEDSVRSICAIVSRFPDQKGIFQGYTSMIGLLDHAYLDCTKSRTSSRWEWTKEPLVLEAILNVRNYFMIVNAVLNPDDENLGTALHPVYEILREILRQCTNKGFVKNLVYLLKEVVRTILFAFGVLYIWVSVALSDPAAKLGAGLGGTVGGVYGGFFGVVSGAVLGALVGNGIKNLFGKQQENDLQKYRLFWGQCPGHGQQHALGNADGDVQNAEEYLFSFTGGSSGELSLDLQFRF